MAWLPNIPQPNNLLSQSQVDLLNNFIALNTVVNPTIGNHLFPRQPADPAASALNIQVYSKQSLLVPAYQALFLEREMGAAGPLPAIVEWTTALAAVSGWTRFPSGILFQWGSFVSNANAVFGAIAFPILFPTACYQVILTIQGGIGLTGNVFTNTITAANFNGWRWSGGPDNNPKTVSYMAIGV